MAVEIPISILQLIWKINGNESVQNCLYNVCQYKLRIKETFHDTEFENREHARID